MRILRIAHSSLTPELRQRERALARRFPDVELELVTTERWREAEVDVEAQPDDLFPVRTARSYLSKHIQLFAYDPRPIIRALRAHRPHLIDLGHESYSVAGAEVLTLCRWFAPNVPIVMQANQNIHHNYPPPFSWFEQRAFKRVAAAYGCSESVCEVLRGKGFAKPAPVVPFGVDTDAFRPRAHEVEKTNRPLTIGYIGRMLPGKGLNVLAEALEKIKGEAWQLLVVGDGSERENFEQRLREARLHDRAEFTGAVSFALMPEYFQRLDVMVIPTETTKRVREQFGRVIVEAMASGVPVIGSTCGAIPEVIGDAGLVFPEGNATALANALRSMLADGDLRQRLVAAGQARVEQYSWTRVAEMTYELFRRVLDGKEQTAPKRSLASAQVASLGCAILCVLDCLV
ncbi:MAG TPA: glycosyltransferase family 4 protein [Pyrinomonadaceae bacterium]|jgi:glycosyltransferase involved in cell wall biosynthesis|nr:glycosyltransferase family 4 protein [Pyrinomonadaceae bacterium]